MVKPILKVDGLEFRDLNANGKLDVYEDWRKTVSERTDNLISLMTIVEKIGLMFHINTGGTFSPQYPSDDAYLATNAKLIVDMNATHILDNNNGTPEYLANFHNQLQKIAE